MKAVVSLCPKSKEYALVLYAEFESFADQYREKKRQNNTFDLVATVHEAEQANLKPEIPKDIPPDHRFEVTLEPDTFTEEKYMLFQNYQRHVHHESDGEISRMGFQRFLCSTPLHRHDVDRKMLGSFHHTYRLDGRLIAMSVLDLLPRAVSGVYFIYHSDFEKWSFGKLSALREAALAIEQGYELLYMGYYIHSCKKMRYKADYKPQYVLDYDTWQWDPLDDEMIRLMDERKWVSMSRERRIKELIEQAGEDDESEPDPIDDEIVSANVYAVNYPEPVAAVQSLLSILDLRMPGAQPLEHLQDKIILNDMKVTIGIGVTHRMQDIVSWATGSVTDPSSIKGAIAEYAACVGHKIANEVVVDLEH